MVCNGNCNCNCEKFNGKTYIGLVIDESGSMETCKGATISGFNEYIQTQKSAKIDGEVLVTLTKFSDNPRVIYSNKLLNMVPELNDRTYVPAGWTALFDAVAHTVTNMERLMTSSDRALVLIITDGQENNSREYNQNRIKMLIQDRERRGNWTFTYMGANQDAWSNGLAMGIPGHNSINYVQTDQGTNMAFAAAANSTIGYRGQAVGASLDFYAGATSVDELEKKFKNAYVGTENATPVEILDENGNPVSGLGGGKTA